MDFDINIHIGSNDELIQQLANESGICIFDEESFRMAIEMLILKKNNCSKNANYLMSECNKNRVKTLFT